MNVEYLDVFDEYITKTGMRTRDEVHKLGLWHQTFHCWLVRYKEKKQYILFQKRSASKKDFPNTFDVSSAGHLQSGETPCDGIREVEEELGLRVAFDDLISLGIIRSQIQIGSVFKDNEFCNVFMYETETPLDNFIFRDGEVSGIVEMEVNQAISLFNGSNEFAHVKGYEIDSAGHKHIIDQNVTKHNFIPRFNYYLEAIKACQHHSKFKNIPY